MGNLLLLEPAELVFDKVRFQQVYSKSIRLTNVTKAPVEGDIKPSSSDRYSISPVSFRLKPGESLDLTVSLKLGPKFALRRKAVEAGQRDPFFIKTPFFDQRFFSTFYLHAEEEHKQADGGSSRTNRYASPQHQAPSPPRVQSAERQRSMDAPAASPPRAAAASPLRGIRGLEAATTEPGRPQTLQHSVSAKFSDANSNSSRSPGGVRKASSFDFRRNLGAESTVDLPEPLAASGSVSTCSEFVGSSLSTLSGSSRLLRWRASTAAAAGAGAVKGSSHRLQPEPRMPAVPAPQPHKESGESAVSAPDNNNSTDAGVPTAAAVHRRVRKSVSFAGLPPPGAGDEQEAVGAAIPTLRRSFSESASGGNCRSNGAGGGAGAGLLRLGSLNDSSSSRLWELPRWESIAPSQQTQEQQLQLQQQQQQLHLPCDDRHGKTASGKKEGLHAEPTLLQLSQGSSVASAALSAAASEGGLQQGPEATTSGSDAVKVWAPCLSTVAEDAATPQGVSHLRMPSRAAGLLETTADSFDHKLSYSASSTNQQQASSSIVQHSPEKPSGVDDAIRQASYQPARIGNIITSTSAATAAAGAAATGGAAGTDNELAHQDVQDEVGQLRAALSDSQQELESSRALVLELQHVSPDAAKLFEAGVKQEQARQEERNRRALELLLQKDVTIQSLRKQLSASQAAQQQLASDAADLQAAAAAANARADALQAALQAAESSAAAELTTLKRQHADVVAALEDRLSAQGQQLLSASQEVLTLSAQLASSSLAEQRHQGTASRTASADEASVSLSGGIAGAAVADASRGALGFEGPPALCASSDMELRSQANGTPRTTPSQSSHQVLLPPAEHQLPPDGVPAADGRYAQHHTQETLLPSLGAASSSENSAALADAFAAADAANTRHAELLSVLAERDAAVARLEAQLAVAHSALRGQAEGPGETGAVAQVVLLQRDLGDALAELQASRERLAELEALQALSEAAAEEGGLLAAAEQCSAGAARRQAAQSATEAQVARLTAERLNARVTALEGQLADLTAAKEALEDQLQRQQELSAREIGLMRRKLSALLAAGGPNMVELERELNDVLSTGDDQLLQQQPAAASLKPSPSAVAAPGSHNAPCAARPDHQFATQRPAGMQQQQALTQEGMLSAALEDAESAVALLQSKLVAVTTSAATAEARVADLQQRLAAAAVRRTREVAAARAAGEVQLAALQEAVDRLGQRGEMAGQVAALSLEVCNLKRAEVQLAGEIALLQQQLGDTQQQLEDARHQLCSYKCQTESTAISCTYPLLRAGRLLEGWAGFAAAGDTHANNHDAGIPAMQQGATSGINCSWLLHLGASNSSNSNKAGRHTASQQQQQQQLNCHSHDPGHALQRQWTELSPEQRAAAAAAASAWVSEMARGQQLLSEALQRAESAEMQLAAVRLEAGADTKHCRQQGGLSYKHSAPSLTDLASSGSQQCIPVLSGSAAADDQRGQPGRHAAAAAASLAACSDPEELREQLLSVQQELMAVRAELRAARQHRELADVELSRLSAELQATSAAAADAQGLLEAAEARGQQRLHAAQAALLKAEQQAADEVTAAHQKVARAEVQAAEASAERDEAIAEAAAARQQLAAAKAEASRAVSEAAAVRQSASAQAQDTRQQLAAKDRELSRLSAELDSQQMRACVLLETLETLQAGQWDTEGQQRLVSLTAQVAAQAAQLAAADQRQKELLAEAEARATSVAQLRLQLESAQQEAAGRAAAAAAAEDVNAGLTRQLGELRDQLKASAQQAARPARELAVVQQRLAAAEAEAEGLKAALEAAQRRHMEQLTKAREDAAASAQRALAQTLQHEPPHAYIAHVAHLTAALDSLLAAVQDAVRQHKAPTALAALTTGSSASRTRRSSSAKGTKSSRVDKVGTLSTLAVLASPHAEAASSYYGDVSWVAGVLVKMKELLMQSDRMYVQSRLEAELSRQRSASLSAQLAASQAAEERLMASWQAAARAKQYLLGAMEQRDRLAAAHGVERMQMQERHIEVLSSRAQQLSQQLVTAQATASTAQAAAAAARRMASSLSFQLEAALSEADALRRMAAASAQEAAGAAQWGQNPAGNGLGRASHSHSSGSGSSGSGGHESVGEAVRRRDEGLIHWFEGRIASLLKASATKQAGLHQHQQPAGLATGAEGGGGGGGHNTEGEQQETRLLVLVREVCGLKLVESQLLASLAAANARSDAATLRAQRLSAALEAATARLSAVAAGPDSITQSETAGSAQAIELADLQAQLLTRATEAYQLQDQLLKAKQLAAALELEVSELQRQLADNNRATAEQQAADAAALVAQRAALTAAAAAEEARLRREVQELRQLLQQQSNSSSNALDAARTAAELQANESAAAAAEAAHAADASALHAAEVRIALLEGQLEVTELERDELQQQVLSLQAQVDELQAAGEVSTSAVQSLEATLAAIERAESRRASHTPSTARRGGPSAAGGAGLWPQQPKAAGASDASGPAAAAAKAQAGPAGIRRVSRSSSSHVVSRQGSAAAAQQDTLLERQQQQQQLHGAGAPVEDFVLDSDADGDGLAAGCAAVAAVRSGSAVSAPSFSRELVKAHMATADTQRKLRVAARTEVELRQRLAERDARICQLKQELSDKGRQADALQRRVNELLGSSGGGGASGSRGLSTVPSLSPRSPRATASSNSRQPPEARQRSSTGAGVAGGSHAAGVSEANAVQSSHEALDASGCCMYAELADSRVSQAAAQAQAAAEKEYLAHQIAALRISLAKRDADVARLEGALAEAVAQKTRFEGMPHAATAAPGRASNHQTMKGSTVTLSQQQQCGSLHGISLHLRPASLQLSQRFDSSNGLTSSSGGLLSSPAGSKLSSHSATAAVRLAREASLRAATQAEQAHQLDSRTSASQTAAAASSRLCQDDSQLAAVQLAAANAQLASALATAKQVLSDLVLGSDPPAHAAMELESKLKGFGLEEALTELVYQVQDKLGTAAAAAEAATEQASAMAEAAAAAEALVAEAQQAAAAGSRQNDAQLGTGLAGWLPGSTLGSRPPSTQLSAVHVDSVAAEREALAAQLDALAAQLEELAAEKAGLAARAEAAAAAHGAVAQQLASVCAERDSLVQQNASLSAALSDQLTGPDAAANGQTHADAAGVQGDSQQHQQPLRQQSIAGHTASPAQLRELGLLLQRLTQENAALIKARDTALSQHSGVAAEAAHDQTRVAELQAQLEASRQEVSLLQRAREQLEVEMNASRRQLQEVAATQDSLRAQIAGARAERDTLADQNVALARTTQQLMLAAVIPTADDVAHISPLAGPASAPTSAATGPYIAGADGPAATRPRAASEPGPTVTHAASSTCGATTGTAAAAGDGATAAAQRITSGQLREIGAMLSRLTRENASLIKQRDKLEEASCAAVTAVAAADAAAAERQALLKERAAAKEELEAARAGLARTAATVKQLTSERDRLMLQVSTLIAERDSMASQNMTLADTTSRLIAASTGDFSGPRSASAPGATGMGDAADAADIYAHSNQASAMAPPQRHSANGAIGGATLSPSQAREIGALLTRLTNENTQFLKARDAAVVSRDEALNRASTLEVELELRQQQLSELAAELQSLRASSDYNCQDQQQAEGPRGILMSSPTHSSASTLGPRQVAGAAGPAGLQAGCNHADAASTRMLDLCCSIQHSLSCAESVQAALSQAIAASDNGREVQRQQQQQQQQPTALPQYSIREATLAPDTLVQVLGAELSTLKGAVQALGQQLQQQHQAASGSGQHHCSTQQHLLDAQHAPRPSSAGAGEACEGRPRQQQLQQEEGADFAFHLPHESSCRSCSSFPAAPTNNALQQQVPQQDVSAAGGASGGGAVVASAAAFAELQGAVQHHQRRCSKWKARCKQLAQQLSLVTAKLSTAQPQAHAADAAADAAAHAVLPSGSPKQQQQQQQQQATSAVVGGGSAEELLERLHQFELQLDRRLDEATAAAGRLLVRGEQLASGAAESGSELEGQLQPLMTAAAGLEAQLRGLESRLTGLQQQQLAAEFEHRNTIEGAAELRGQLLELQTQLHDTAQAFAAEQYAVSAALAEAQAARDEALASAAAAAQELEGLRQQLAEMEAAQAHAMAEVQSRHLSETTELRRQLLDATAAGEALASAALSDRLADAQAGRTAAEAALCQLAEDMRAFQQAKSAEVARLEQQLEAMLAAAPATLAAQFLAEAAAAAPATEGGSSSSSSGRNEQLPGVVFGVQRDGSSLSNSMRAACRRRNLLGRGIGVRSSGNVHRCAAATAGPRTFPAGYSRPTTAGRTHHINYRHRHGLLSSSRSNSSSRNGMHECRGNSSSNSSCGASCSDRHESVQQQQQHEQQQDISTFTSALVRGLHAAESLSVAAREARWERLGRIKAEAAADLVRAAAARLKVRLRAARSELNALKVAARKGASASAELPRLQAELTAAKEGLKAARADQQRQQQRLRNALATVAATATAASGGSADTAANLLASAAQAAAVAAAGNAAGSSSSSSNPSVTAGSSSNIDGVSDVVGVLIAFQKELSGQAACREALEAKLRETKATIDRKNTLVKDLRARVESLTLQLSSCASASALEERALTAEGRAKALAASLGRKDAALKEAQAELAAIKAQLAAVQQQQQQQAAAQALAAAAAGGCVGGGHEAAEAKGAGGVAVRIRGELARKEAALQAVTADLERIKQQLAAAQAAAAKQQAAVEASFRRQAARQQQRLVAAGEAVRSAAALLLSCMATMAAAASLLQRWQQQQINEHQQQQQHASAEPSQAATADADAVTAVAGGGVEGEESPGCLADMVCLSQEELADLLGPDDDTCRLLLGLQHQQQHQQQLDGQQEAAGAACQALLLSIEAEEVASQQQQQLQQQLSAALEQLLEAADGKASAAAPAAAASCHHHSHHHHHSSSRCSSCRSSIESDKSSSSSSGGGGGSRSVQQGGAQQQQGGVVASGNSGPAAVRGLLLQPVLQAMTQDVGARQGVLRAAVSLVCNMAR